MVCLQDFDRPTQYLAADFIRGHLSRFILAGRQITVDTGETGDDADLQWRLCKGAACRKQHGQRSTGNDFFQCNLPNTLTRRCDYNACHIDAKGRRVAYYACPLSSIFVQRLCMSAGLTTSFGWASDQR